MAETLRPPDVLLEREDELARLRARLDAAAQGQGGVVVVEGPAGIGKTRLLAAMRAEAGGTATVLSARCSELERDFAFGAVRQLLEPAVRDPRRREQVLQGAAAAAGPVLDASADAPAEGAFAALHGLHWAVLELADDRPVLLAVDDLQWSDRASLRFLAYLARRLEGVPVLVAATVRSTDPGTDPVLLAEVCGDPATTVLRPGPLGAEAVRALCSARLGATADPGFSAACAEATGGNPLLLHQLLSALDADGVRPTAEGAAAVREIGPRAVSRTVLLRLARLPGAAVAVARAVAVLGEQATLPAVAAFCALPEPEVAAAVGALARADVLQPDATGAAGFVHPLVRGAVYDDLPPGERELAHARAAEVLRDRGGSGPAIAAQLLHAPPRGDATTVATLRAAAADAERRGSPESAVAFLTRALHEPPGADDRPTVLLELGLAEAEMDPPAAAEHLRLAQDVLVAPGDRATAGFVRAQALIFTSRSAEGSRLARTVAAQLPDERGDDRDALRGLEVLAVYFGGGDPGVLASLDALAPGWVPEGPGGRFLAGAATFSRATGAHPSDEVERLAALATDGDPLMRASGLLWSAVLTALVLVESPTTGKVLEAARAQEHRRGSYLGLSSIGLFGGLHLLQLGDLDDAEEQLRQAVASQEPLGNDPTTRRWSQSMLGTLALLRGDPGTATTLLGDPPEEHETSDGANLARGVQAELLLAQGRPADALAVTDAMLRIAPYVVHPAWKRAPSPRARALHALGRTPEAVRVLDDAIALARRAGGPALTAQLLRDLAAVTPDDALDLLREALDALERSSARLERALTLLAYGAALRRDRHPTEARGPLREALALAEACGCEPAVRQARTELQATGVRPRTGALGGVAALTASELRVAGLVAEGHTNREVAQTLFVTPKTVEVHLSNAYRKLGIRSRRELAGALA